MSAAARPPTLVKVVSFLAGAVSVPHLEIAAREVSDRAFANADLYDEDSAYPSAEVMRLHEAGLLTATLPREYGGAALGGLGLCTLFRQIGSGSLPVGRLFEGHVNALALVLRYGRREQVALVASEVHEGKMFGVWNTNDGQGLRLVCKPGRYHLEGRKILASGAGHIERPIITASDGEGRKLIVMPRLRLGERADHSHWTAHGMRASATGAVDFSGIPIDPIEIVGSDGDYERQPAFSGGAWRFAAVHLGGMERLFDLLRVHLRSTGRGSDPHQAARLGQAAIAGCPGIFPVGHQRPQ
jgi:alkylation response protein AidB-like acyl-CoA dehydrogenase